MSGVIWIEYREQSMFFIQDIIQGGDKQLTHMLDIFVYFGKCFIIFNKGEGGTTELS